MDGKGKGGGGASSKATPANQRANRRLAQANIRLTANARVKQGLPAKAPRQVFTPAPF